jgi:hypothetical protein
MDEWFALAIVFAIAVYETQNWSPEKTLNFVMFSEFLTHPHVHHTYSPSRLILVGLGNLQFLQVNGVYPGLFCCKIILVLF